MFSSPWPSESPGEEKPSLDYLLTICLVFVWEVAEYTLAQIPGHYVCWLLRSSVGTSVGNPSLPPLTPEAFLWGGTW